MKENKKFNSYPDFPNFIPDKPIPPAPCMPPIPPAPCMPPIPPAPCMPPVPSVVEGSDLYEAMNNLSKRVNVCISTYNDVMANCYETLKNLERAGEANGAYYNNCEVWTEQGYYADENAGYTITHKANLDRHGHPIRIKLHLPYNNITNSGVYQNIFDASMITYADKIFTAQPNTVGEDNVSSKYYGVCLQNGTPINGVENATLYTYGFTKMGTLKVYQNSVTINQLLADTVVDSMGCSGVLIQNGEVCADAFFENIPSYNVQTSRIAIGQNAQTKEVIILCCGNTNAVNMAGLTSKAVANIMLGLGCTIAVEVAEGTNIGMLDKGQMLFEPSDDNSAQNNSFFYISRRKFYKNDFTEELAKLTQNYGQVLWENFLNGKQIEETRDTLSAQIENLEQELADHEAEANASYVKKSGDTMTGALDMNGNNVNNVSGISSTPTGILNLFSNSGVTLNNGSGFVSAGFKRIQNVLNPTFAEDAANKQYVDNADNALRNSITENTEDIASNTSRIASLEESVSGWTAALASMQTTVANLQETVNQNNVLLAQIIAGEADINYVRKTGDTMSGPLDMGSQNLNNVSAVTSGPSTGLNLFSNVSVNLNNGSGSILASGKKIQNVGNPTTDSDAANKLYVDTVESTLQEQIANAKEELQGQIDENDPEGRYLPLSGGTMTGDIALDNHNLNGVRTINGYNSVYLNLNSNTGVNLNTGNGTIAANNKRINSVANPVSSSDAATKEYVDGIKDNLQSQITENNPEGGYLPLNGGTMTGGLTVPSISGVETELAIESDADLNNHKITGGGEPTQATDLTTKQYVDTAVEGVDPEGKYLALSGGKMSGDINLGRLDSTHTNRISNGKTSGATDFAYLQLGLGNYATSVLASGGASISVGKNGGGIVLSGSNVQLQKSGTISANNNKINDVGTPVSDTDAANKQYVDNAITNSEATIAETYLPLSGGVLTGNVSLKDNNITQVNQLSGNNLKLFSNANIVLQAGSGGISANNKTISNLSNPTLSNDAVNKQYVDNAIANEIQTYSSGGYSAKFSGSLGKIFSPFNFVNANPGDWFFNDSELCSFVHGILGNVTISVDGVVSGNNVVAVFTASMTVTETQISFSDASFSTSVPIGDYGIIVHI